MKALVFVALAGCFSTPYNNSLQDMAHTFDGCGGISQSCVTLHLAGMSDGPFDTITVDAAFELAGSQVMQRAVSQNVSSVQLPIGVGIYFPQNASADIQFMVVGSLGKAGRAIAEQQGLVVGLRPGTHQSVDVNMIPASKSRCFDGIKDGYETDVDCGGSECLGCTLGKRCAGSGGCVDSTCAFGDGSDEYCQ
jgi:hypothetical protein